MWDLKTLTMEQVQMCMNTVSSNTFLFIVGDALDRGGSLSTVRMADGEHILMDWCRKAEDRKEIVKPNNQLDKAWLEKFGVSGITYGELSDRLVYASNAATYFCASISGITMGHYNVYDFSKRDRYVDNFFNYGWSEEYKLGLCKKAGHVLLIHHSRAVYDSLKVNAEKIGVKVSYIQMSNWRDTERVVTQANNMDAKLVLYSAGPAGKIIAPQIADPISGGVKKVVLDVGSAIQRWMLDGINHPSGELINS